MKTLLITFLTIISIGTGYSQEVLTYSYVEESRKYDQTYVVEIDFPLNTNIKYLDISIKAYKGQGDNISSITFAENAIKLKVTEFKEIHSGNSEKDITGRIKTSFQNLETLKKANIPSEIGNHQILWSLIPEFHIKGKILLATFGNDTLILKRKE